MLVLSLLSLLCSSAVTSRRDRSILYARSVITVLILCIVISLSNFHSQFLYKGIGLFHGLFYDTATTHIFSIFILLISCIIIQVNAFHSRKVWSKDMSTLPKLLYYKLVYFNNYISNKMAEQHKIIEYCIIILFVVIGGIFLMSSSNLISIFICIELQSYGLYILCTLYRDSEKAVSAGLTYFLLGGLSSCFILLASGLLYGNTGSVNLDGLYIVNNITNANNNSNIVTMSQSSLFQSYYINLALTIMSIGFLFKVTAAPFHFWSPDVYDAIPTIVTTFVAIFTKISIFILLLQLVNYTGHFLVNKEQNETLYNFSWTYTFLISSLLSMVIGSLLGLTQFRIKRLYAYSTINQIGFIMLALTINSIESIQSFIFYLLQYSLANLNAFMLLIAIGYSLYVYVEKKDSISSVSISDKKNSPLQLISQIKGYFYINPTLAVSLIITLFSFVGIPPLVGFFAKQMVLSSAIDNGYVFISFIAILTSVISAYYYLSLVKQMFFSKSDYVVNPLLKDISIKGTILKNNNTNKKGIIINRNNIVLSSFLSITISILTLIILLFILDPQEWLSIANILALTLYNC